MNSAANPLLENWNTPHGLPPFERIRAEHFAGAFDVAMKAHRAEIDAIAARAEAASFDNTLRDFDRSGRDFARIEMLFSNLCSSESSPELRAAEMELAPRIAAHTSAIYLNQGLFERVQSLHERRATLGLDAEEMRLLERVHLDFVLAGARLAPASRERQARVAERLATLYTQFSQHVLGDEADFQLVLDSEEELAGLPGFVRDAARGAAAQRGMEGRHVIALSRSLMVPFLTYSTRRDLREKLWRAWVSRGEMNASRDTRSIAAEIVALRLELAQLHGFASFADYALQDRMAGTPSAVLALLQRVWSPALERASQDRAALEETARAAGESADIQPWDWRHYAEKVRRERFDIRDDELKPYFQLDRMMEAMFDCAMQLFGVRFQEIAGAPSYHPDVRTFEVRRAGSEELVGVFLSDNFARPSKRGGAWMSLYRQQSRNGGARPGDAVLPIVVNNNNFAKAAAGQPTLLGFDDVRTLFHEFGHGLHGLLSQARFERLSGTNVLRDFVELPSQLFEHWALEPQVLRRHARHVHTGEPIPDALIERLKASRRFNQAYDTVQYVGSALIDIALHRLTTAQGLDIAEFERAQRRELGVPEAVGLMHRLPHFRHLFASDGYAAGYYVYMWAEVLDADAYQAFREAGDIFDAATAARLLKHVYAAGNTVDPRETYRSFRGRDADVQAMLVKRGLMAEPTAAA